ncbi:MAG: DUF4276 family protein [Fimbriimonadaceae bacterium]|nr:DUF4276 family protein [Fimbriimonadaceae bacterium]
MNELVFLLEEESAKALLEGLLPRLLGAEADVRFIVFEGKRQLFDELERKLRGYCTPGAQFIVLCDLDNHPDCRALKQNLRQSCLAAGRPATIVRLACHELESFYLADLAAVEQALGLRGLSAQQAKRKWRQPDRLESPSRELQKLTAGRYQKVAGSRALGPLLNLDNTRSPSFVALVAAIRRLAGAEPPGQQR